MRWILKTWTATLSCHAVLDVMWNLQLHMTLTCFSPFLLRFFFARTRRSYRRLAQWKRYLISLWDIPEKTVVIILDFRLANNKWNAALRIDWQKLQKPDPVNQTNRIAVSDVMVKWAAQWALYCETWETASRQISDKIDVDQVIICLFRKVKSMKVLWTFRN